MTNPIPARWRGWFYLAAIIVGNVASSVSAALLILGVDARWQAVATIFLGNVMSTLGILARNNLTADAPADPSSSTTEATPATGGA